MTQTNTDFYQLRDKIKDVVVLHEYLNKYYPELNLKDKGKRHLCKCPFVEEKDASFNVYHDSNKFYCYSCGEKGDVIQFVSKYENIDFKEACEKIANNENISYEILPVNDKHEEYKNFINNSCNRYEYELFNNKAALEYINLRGISDKTIKEFRLGFVPKGERNKRPDAVYDIEGRISFPFLEYGRDNTTRCVGMAYRTLEEHGKPKYTNDANYSDSDGELNGVFNKGNFLFGFNQAKSSIKEKDCVIVVEGYFDVLSLYQSGIYNVCGTCGTAFTEAQADLLSRLTKNIIYFHDNDSPGISSMYRALPMLLSRGLNVKFVLPDCKINDAADLCYELEFEVKKIEKFINDNSYLGVKLMIDKSIKKFNDIILDNQIKILNDVDGILKHIVNENEYLVFKEYLSKELRLK